MKRRDGRCFLLTIPEHPFYRKRNVFLRSGISQFSLFEDHKGPLRPAAILSLEPSSRGIITREARNFRRATSFLGDLLLFRWHMARNHFCTLPHTVTADFVTGRDLGRSRLNHHRRFFWIDSTRQKFPLFTRRFHLPSQMLSHSIFPANFIYTYI